MKRSVTYEMSYFSHTILYFNICIDFSVKQKKDYTTSIYTASAWIGAEKQKNLHCYLEKTATPAEISPLPLRQVWMQGS